MNDPLVWAGIFTLVVGLTFLGAALHLTRKSRADGSRTAPVAVAAAPESVPPKLRDLLERMGELEADVQTLTRKLGDLDKHWERRWGTLARQGRRDAAADAAQQLEAAAAAEGDPAQMEFPVGQPSAPAGERRQLRPMRIRLGNG